jgi:hypothetical protein
VFALLFRLSTTLIVPLLLALFVRSNLFFSSFSNTVFAAHGFTVTGILIGATHGIFIVITSVPALKLGYRTILFVPLSSSVITKSFDFTKLI